MTYRLPARVTILVAVLCEAAVAETGTWDADEVAFRTSMTVIHSAAAVGRETEDGTVTGREIGIVSETVIVNATANVIETGNETERGIATGIA